MRWQISCIFLEVSIAMHRCHSTKVRLYRIRGLAKLSFEAEVSPGVCWLKICIVDSLPEPDEAIVWKLLWKRWITIVGRHVMFFLWREEEMNMKGLVWFPSPLTAGSGLGWVVFERPHLLPLIWLSKIVHSPYHEDKESQTQRQI